MGKSTVIFQQLVSAISRGEYGDVNTPFITIRELCTAYGISPVTAQKIVDQLKVRGILARSGKRLLIASRKDDSDRKRRIGALVTDLDNPFFSRLLNAAELAGRRRTIEVISAASNYDLQHERHQLDMLRKSGADGFIICPTHDVQSAETLNQLERPFVLVGHQVRDVNADVVQVDDFLAGRKVAQHLCDQRCAEFLYLGQGSFQNDLRCCGFLFELRDKGYVLPSDCCFSMTAHHESDDLMQWICRHVSGKRVGIFCYHDLLAARVIRIARLCKLEVPQNLAVIWL